MLMRTMRKAVLGILLLPYAVFGVGAISNQAVLIANHSKFPVRVTDAWLAARGEAVLPSEAIDTVHSRMSEEDSLKFLADIFVWGPRILSVGDALMVAGSWLSQYSPIIALCLFLFKKVDTDSAKA